MFVRIVKMSFHTAHIETFLKNFESKKEAIRNFPGCQFLELYRDKDNPNIFLTYSYWNQPSDLENYRNSELFKSIWAKTKVFFNDKPQAWSVDKISSLS